MNDQATSVYDVLLASEAILNLHGFELNLTDDFMALTIEVDDKVLIFPMNDVIDGVHKYQPEQLVSMMTSAMLGMIEQVLGMK